MKDLAERYRKATLDFISLHNIYQPTATKSKRVLCARLKNTRIFFHVLGNPDKDLRIIHVAGTSGKGSVVQLLHRILQANGENVASYISPHTTTYLERFLFNNALIDTELLLECIEEVTCIYAKFLEKNAPLSFMDISTGLGLYTFKKAGARWCVLETGCGGRYDGTNAISGAEIDIITNISKDHTEVLGDTLEDIALAKAGIMKKNGTAIVGERRPRLKKIFCEEAVKKEAALFFITNEVHHRNPTLAGQHQGQNTAIALAAAKELQIPDESIEKALSTHKPLPCRFETIQDKPHIILDGAHNTAKIASTVALAKRLNKKVYILLASTVKKDIQKSIKILLPIAQKIHTTRFSVGIKKVESPAKLMKMIPTNKRGNTYINAKDAVQDLRKNLKKEDILLVTGSMYLAGEVREVWIPETSIISRSNSF